MKKKWNDSAPFHVEDRKHNGSHVGYDIHCKGRPFLRQVQHLSPAPNPAETTPPLKRHEAYAIARLLNSEQAMLKWAAKFADPYPDDV